MVRTSSVLCGLSLLLVACLPGQESIVGPDDVSVSLLVEPVPYRAGEAGVLSLINHGRSPVAGLLAPCTVLVEIRGEGQDWEGIDAPVACILTLLWEPEILPPGRTLSATAPLSAGLIEAALQRSHDDFQGDAEFRISTTVLVNPGSRDDSFLVPVSSEPFRIQPD